MSFPKPITIVGGGLAGLTLGIGLRQRGVPATVWEAARYPRHRVCGEFISGRGLETLARLDLQQLVLSAGATPARTAAFFSRRTASRPQTLPSPALCVSRFILDDRLAGEFRRLGGELRAGERWRDPFSGEGVVRATGRHAHPAEKGWRWFGLKAHARQVSLRADLEMHVAPHGYVGLCRLAGDEVNVCGLFRRRAGMEAARLGRELLFGEKGSLLRERLAGAVLEEGSFCSVAGLALKPQRAAAPDECRVGDAITMIPPMTGNGMSMAFESAEIALETLWDWSRDRIDWTQARQTIAGRCDAVFKRRLAWAERLQTLVLKPMLQGPLVGLVSRSGFWRVWFERTR
jgi:flavin-dependent dehydrogenase